MIRIDVSRIIPQRWHELADHPEVAAQVVQELTNAAAQKWRRLAQTELGATKAIYQDGVQQPVWDFGDPLRPSGRIELVGMLPNMLEHGWGGGDMRQWLCGPNAKNRKPVRDKDGQIIGYYNVIPFRHGTPSSQGQAGPPMGSQFMPTPPSPPGLSRRAMPQVAFSVAQDDPRAMALHTEATKTLGKRIYKEAKKLEPTFTTYDSEGRASTAWGGRLQAGLAPKLQEHHRTDIFAGMVRQQTTYEGATQSQYTTFRTISTRVTNGWIHPGLTPRHFMQKVQDHIRKIAPAAIRLALRGIQ